MQNPETEMTSDAPPATEQPPAASDVATHPVNSVDATAHQPIVERVAARVRELESLLEALPADAASKREEISTALATVKPMLTGDLAKVPPVVGVDLNRWLERNKHVGEQNK
jgi:hypothetical protein